MKKVILSFFLLAQAIVMFSQNVPIPAKPADMGIWVSDFASVFTPEQVAELNILFHTVEKNGTIFYVITETRPEIWDGGLSKEDRAKAYGDQWKLGMTSEGLNKVIIFYLPFYNPDPRTGKVTFRFETSTKMEGYHPDLLFSRIETMMKPFLPSASRDIFTATKIAFGEVAKTLQEAGAKKETPEEKADRLRDESSFSGSANADMFIFFGLIAAFFTALYFSIKRLIANRKAKKACDKNLLHFMDDSSSLTDVYNKITTKDIVGIPDYLKDDFKVMANGYIDRLRTSFKNYNDSIKTLYKKREYIEALSIYENAFKAYDEYVQNMRTIRASMMDKDKLYLSSITSAAASISEKMVTLDGLVKYFATQKISHLHGVEIEKLKRDITKETAEVNPDHEVESAALSEIRNRVDFLLNIFEKKKIQLELLRTYRTFSVNQVKAQYNLILVKLKELDELDESETVKFRNELPDAECKEFKKFLAVQMANIKTFAKITEWIDRLDQYDFVLEGDTTISRIEREINDEKEEDAAASRRSSYSNSSYTSSSSSSSYSSSSFSSSTGSGASFGGGGYSGGSYD